MMRRLHDEARPPAARAPVDAPAAPASAPSARARKTARFHDGMGPSGFGMIHGGVRWNTEELPTRAAMVGTIWMALAPVPTTPTFLPSSGYAWSQRAEWNVLPSNDASPGMSGSDGRLSGPHPGTSTRARSVLPSLVSTSHSPARSSKRARRDPGAEPDVRPDAVLVGAVPQVRQDFRLRREVARPLRPRLEGERVEVRLHVARGTRDSGCHARCPRPRPPAPARRNRRCRPASSRMAIPRPAKPEPTMRT